MVLNRRFIPVMFQGHRFWSVDITGTDIRPSPNPPPSFLMPPPHLKMIIPPQPQLSSSHRINPQLTINHMEIAQSRSYANPLGRATHVDPGHGSNIKGTPLGAHRKSSGIQQTPLLRLRHPSIRTIIHLLASMKVKPRTVLFRTTLKAPPQRRHLPPMQSPCRSSRLSIRESLYLLFVST